MAELKLKKKQEATAKYTKAAAIHSRTYERYRDILEAVLEDGKAYTHDEIREKINGFLERS